MQHACCGSRCHLTTVLVVVVGVLIVVGVLVVVLVRVVIVIFGILLDLFPGWLEARVATGAGECWLSACVADASKKFDEPQMERAAASRRVRPRKLYSRVLHRWIDEAS